MKQICPKRVAVLLPLGSDMMYDIWSGFREVATDDHRVWVARIDTGPEGLALLKKWKPDYILGHVVNQQIVELYRGLNAPVLNTSGIMDPCPFPTVNLDNFKTGEMAAQHLLDKKYTSFAYIGPPNHGYSLKRLAGFQARVESAGHTVVIRQGALRGIGMKEPDSVRPMAEELLAWYKTLPPGTGFFCVDDHVAIAFMELLDYMGFPPLEQSAVISGHHFRLPFFPGISGVRQNETQWGGEAARLIIRHLFDGTPIPQLTLVPPIGVTEMESTAGVYTDDAQVRDAVRYVRHHVHRGINVSDVVGASDLGRRALERRFLNVMGHSILEEIQRARMERAKQMLRESSRNLQDIALACGFTDHKHLQRVFTQREGVNPGFYRQQMLG